MQMRTAIEQTWIEQITRVGVNVSDVQNWIQTGLGGQALCQIIEGDRRFDLVVRLPENHRRDSLPRLRPGPHLFAGRAEAKRATTVQRTLFDASPMGAKNSGNLCCGWRFHDRGSFGRSEPP